MQNISINENHNWNSPLSLEGNSLLPWPLDVLPDPFMTYVKELARSTETPIELSALLTLAVVSTAAQAKYEVQVKTDYIEPINLWILGILPPASRKSRIYSDVTSPLRKWECEQKLLMEPLIASAGSKRKTMEARLKELRIRAAKAKESEYAKIQAEIEQIECNLPEVPQCPQIWTSDVTPEHLGCIMAANQESMAILSDEGGIFDILGGLYSDGKANIDLFLQAHSAGSVRVDRGSRAPVFMERAVLTMGLTAQPQVVKTICNNKVFRGRGLLGRFLYILPKSNIGKRTLDELPMLAEHRMAYENVMQAILSHPISMKDKQPSLHKLELSQEAFNKWLEYSKLVEALMGDEIGHLSHITDWAGKLAGAIARIAGLLHVMRHAYGQPEKRLISLEDMSAAVKIGHFLINHALAVFDLLDEDNARVIARTILQWIKNEKKNQFTQRECMRRFRRYKKADLRPAFDILKEHEILKEFEIYSENGLGRGSGLFEVNPLIFKT